VSERERERERRLERSEGHHYFLPRPVEALIPNDPKVDAVSIRPKTWGSSRVGVTYLSSLDKRDKRDKA
jgi:hypothetical protein